MNPLQILIESAEFGGRNLSYNLDFIAEDKLGWKPGPDAKTAYEIVHEVATTVSWMPGAFKGEPQGGEIPTPLTRAEAKQMVENAAAAYVSFLHELSEADLEGDIQLPFGAFPRSRALALPVLDMMHHHGQIAYIQTLLGDKVSHFAEMGT